MFGGGKRVNIVYDNLVLLRLVMASLFLVIGWGILLSSTLSRETGGEKTGEFVGYWGEFVETPGETG